MWQILIASSTRLWPSIILSPKQGFTRGKSVKAKINIGQTLNTLANIGVIAGIVFLAVELGQNDVER